VRDVVDNSGTVQNHIVYDAFGNIISQTNPSVEFRYTYTARELDKESIQEDKIGFGGGDTNLSRYVVNSPLNLTDPSGNNPLVFAIPFIARAAPYIIQYGPAVVKAGVAALTGVGLINKYVDRPEPVDPRPLTYPASTPKRGEPHKRNQHL
jgi:hypothetical protein